MNRPFRLIGYLVISLFILLLCLYIYTFIVQLWPEPISESFKSACDYDLKAHEVSARRHSYSNWMHGVWYTDHGKVDVSEADALEISQNLAKNETYQFKDDQFEKFIVGDTLATCKIDSKSGMIEYGLVLW